MSTLGSSGRVGVTVVIAIALLTAMFIFFQGIQNTYDIFVTYADASGTVAGMPVHLAGVQIGEVGDITLPKGELVAHVQLKIEKKYSIPAGSKFRIINPVLGGVGSIAVIPPADVATAGGASIQPGSTVDGEPAFDLAGTIGQSSKLIESLTRTAAKTEIVVGELQQLVGDPRLKYGIESSLENINLASQNGVKLTEHLDNDLSTDNSALVSLLDDTKSSAKSSLANVNATTEQIKDMTVSDRARLDEILSNLQDTTSAVAGITTETNESFKAGHFSENLTALMANLKSTTDHLNQIAANLQTISGDTSTQTDLKETIHNIRETTAQSAFLLARLNRLTGNKNTPQPVIINDTQIQTQTNGNDGKTITIKPVVNESVSPITLSPRIDLLQNTAQDHFRADANAIVSLGGKSHSFVDAGIYGLGDTNGLNLEYGQGIGLGPDYRAGLYNSKLGVGADYGLDRNLTFSVDVYNPNHYMVDARGIVMLNKSLGIVLGADDITRQAGGSIGIELRH